MEARLQSVVAPTAIFWVQIPLHRKIPAPATLFNYPIFNLLAQTPNTIRPAENCPNPGPNRGFLHNFDHIVRRPSKNPIIGRPSRFLPLLFI